MSELTPLQKRVAVAVLKRLHGYSRSLKRESDDTWQIELNTVTHEELLEYIGLDQDGLLPELEPCDRGTVATYHRSWNGIPAITALSGLMMTQQGETKAELFERWNDRGDL